MQPEEIKQLIEAGIAGSEAMVRIDEGGHIWVTVVSETFAGQSPLNKERTVRGAGRCGDFGCDPRDTH